MTTTANPLTMHRGDHATMPLVVSTLGDLTGASVTASFANDKGIVVFSRRNAAAGGGASECAIISGAAGTVEIYIVPSNTSGIVIPSRSAETLHYDVQVTTQAGTVATVLEGELIIKADVTR